MPTIKQKKAFKKVLEGTNITNAMKESGYSETTASTTGKLTRSDGWKELMEKYMPEKDLAKAHRKLLEKEEIFSTKSGIVHTGQIHSDAKGALDLAYKLRGSYEPEKRQHSGDLKITWT